MTELKVSLQENTNDKHRDTAVMTYGYACAAAKAERTSATLDNLYLLLSEYQERVSKAVAAADTDEIERSLYMIELALNVIEGASNTLNELTSEYEEAKRIWRTFGAQS